MTEPDAEFVRKREEWKRDRSTSMFYCLIGPRGSVAFQYFPTAPAGLSQLLQLMAGQPGEKPCG